MARFRQVGATAEDMDTAAQGSHAGAWLARFAPYVLIWTGAAINVRGGLTTSCVGFCALSTALDVYVAIAIALALTLLVALVEFVVWARFGRAAGL